MARKVALIDADSIIYILAWHAREHRDEKDVELLLDQFMVDLITITGATHYLGVFTPSRTFRNDLYTPYKANRVGKAQEWVTFWKPIIKKLCVEKYQFFEAEHVEADDVLSIMRGYGEEGDELIFCSPDKDLRQIPGRHYDYSKRSWLLVTPDEADERFWAQMLVGDSTDNIPGCKGIGPKNAEKILQYSKTPGQRAAAVFNAYAQNKAYWDTELKTIATYIQEYNLMFGLLRLKEPTPEKVEHYSKHVIAVEYKDIAELNIEADGQNDGLFPDDQRPHEGDVLRLTSDLSEQV